MSLQTPEEDGILVLRLCSGDEQAFTLLYKKYWYRLYIVANQKLQNKALAEELVQDIFTNLWKDRNLLKIRHLESYLFSAVRFEVIDHIRAYGPIRQYRAYYESFVEDSEENTENTILYNDLLSSMQHGLEMLPDKTRIIFNLRRMENWSVAHIAEHLHISEKAVEYHLTKAHKQLRVYLNQQHITLLILGTSWLIPS